MLRGGLTEQLSALNEQGRQVLMCLLDCADWPDGKAFVDVESRMEVSLTRIRLQLSTAEQWPHCIPGTKHPYAAWRAKFVWAKPPVKPTTWRNCDTDVIWPLPEEWNPELYQYLDISGHPTKYVCRHQIEAGD